MAKVTSPKAGGQVVANKEQLAHMAGLLMNEATTFRRELLQRLLSPARNIDTECQYPTDLTIIDYKEFFDRHGLATRVVSVWPEECWQIEPKIYETEDSGEETEFEMAVEEITRRIPLWNTLFRADVLSGIGQYGVLLLGVNDGKPLSDPIEGIDERGEKVGNKEHELLFVRPFDESVCTIKDYEKDNTNPRYGLPTQYDIKFESTQKVESLPVHWSRVVHLADNRTTSDVLGVPRMKIVYNNLLDIKKISGGSGEMFFKGGFPGYSFELTPEAEAAGATIDIDSMKEQTFLWGQGLQRWLYLTGVTAKSLAPQVADPSGHLDWHVKLMSMALGIPYRVLMGSEEAKLASTQDTKRHNGRVRKRQNNYLTPLVLRPFFDRLIMVGCLPEPKEYFVKWVNLDAPTDEDVANVAVKRTDALSKYVAGGVDALIPPRPYLSLVHKLTDEEIEEIEDEVGDWDESLNPTEPEPVVGVVPGQSKPQPKKGEKVVKKKAVKK